MSIRVLQNVVLSNKNKKGDDVKIKILVGPLSGKEFQAKKVQETIEGKVIYCYHILDNNINTYFFEKDVLIV